MNEERVSVGRLKARLSEYLRRARAGEGVLVTDRGKPVARLVSLEGEGALEGRVAELVGSGREYRGTGGSSPPQTGPPSGSGQLHYVTGPWAGSFLDERGPGPGEEVRQVSMSFEHPPEVPICSFTVEARDRLELVQDDAETNVPHRFEEGSPVHL